MFALQAGQPSTVGVEKMYGGVRRLPSLLITYPPPDSE